LYLSSGQTDRLGRFLVSQGGLLMKKQHETKALDGLDRHSTAGHGVEGHLQEIVREGTESGLRSWHGGILSLPGFLGSLPPSTKSPQKRRRYLWNGPLRSWASIVKSTDIFEEFDGLRSASRLRPESEQFRSCVWAKPFYEQVVYASASGLQSLRGTSYSTWMIDLATNMSVPADLSGIFSEFLE